MPEQDRRQPGVERGAMAQFDNVKVTPAMGQRLARAREDHRLTHQDLADRLDASVTQIIKYERGELDMPLSRLFDLAAILEIPAGELLG